MKCDKCGFEHNSKSVCPKCGARVIYVNEDYEHRKREWEEAQKQGKEQDPLAGIMHSTKEQHDAGKTGAVHEKEGKSEMTGLSFDVIMKNIAGFLMAAGSLAGKLVKNIRSHFVKKRGSSNPVIRKLEFEKNNEKDTINTSKLVLDHKVFKDHRKPVFIGAAAIIIAAVAAAVVVHIVKNTDNSKIFCFDGKSAYYIDKDGEQVLFTDNEQVTLIKGDSNCYLGMASDAIYVCHDGKTEQIKADEPKLVVYNDSFSTIIYIAENTTYLWQDGSSTPLGLDADLSYTDGCMVSSNGEYYVLTACLSAEDLATYTMYYGTSDGAIEQISENDNEKELITVDDDGTVLYLSMETAEYGIVNSKELDMYGAGNKTVIAQAVDRYQLLKDGTLCFYDTAGSLSLAKPGDYSDTVAIDTDVTGFAANELDTANEKAVYYKGDKYYCVDKDKTVVYLMETAAATPVIYYDYSNEYLYFSDNAELYGVSKLGRTPEKICTLYNEADIIYINKDKSLLAVNSDNELMILNDSTSIYEDSVSDLIAIGNSNGFSYMRKSVRYIRENLKSKPVAVVGQDIPSQVDLIMYSEGYFYCYDGDGQLWRINHKGTSIVPEAKVEYIEVIK